MSLFDSLRRGADNYPGARPVIALRIGKTDEVARKELSGAATHKLGAVDALAIARLCVEAGTPHCYDYAVYVAQECGGRFVPGEAAVDAESLNPVNKIGRLVRETSDVTTTVLQAMQDGVVSDNELGQIEREIAEAEEVLRKLRQAARAVNQAGKPAHERRTLLDLPVVDAMSKEAQHA